jgi:cyclic beta-1,2-glucan synthetase
MRPAVLLAYFPRLDLAGAALRRLQKSRFRRSALIHRNSAEAVRTHDPFLVRRASSVAAGGLVLGLGAAIASRLTFPSASVDPVLVAGTAGAVLGGMLMAGLVRRSRHGVERRVLTDYARLLAPEEAVVILQAPFGLMHSAAALLPEGAEAPMLFVLHPTREPPLGAERPPAVALPLAQIEEHALQLAADRRVAPPADSTAGLPERLGEASLWIHQACADLTEASRLEQTPSPVAEWIVDNEYIVEANARDVRLNLPRRYYRELPTLLDDAGRALLRIYTLADELIARTDLHLDIDLIEAFLRAYQSVHSLTIGELWAFPQMLRIILIERIQALSAGALVELRERQAADFWANRLVTVSRSTPGQLFAVMAELTRARPSPSPHFASQLFQHLHDEDAALQPVQGWLERTYHAPLGELNRRERNRQSSEQLAAGNAVTSLRHLALLDWRVVFEKLCRVEQLLRLDPAGVYPQMDFDTRDRYRKAVEELSRGSGRTEHQVAQQAVEAARAAGSSEKDPLWSHVGMYLIGEGRLALAAAISGRETARHRSLGWVRRHSAAVYLSAIGLLTAWLGWAAVTIGAAGRPFAQQALIALLALVPASQLAIEIANYLATRLVPPHTLPKMDFEGSGIPDAFQSLVVVPLLLVDESTIRSEAQKLEIRYLANRDENLLFSLFTDFEDSVEEHLPTDEALLQAAVRALQDLGRKYGEGRFFLFHRPRRWSETERKFIGWERKRGKLEELNRLIEGTRPQAAPTLVHVGAAERLQHVRFILTLDSDTQLPTGTARRLVETLAHPLNQPRFDSRGRVRPGSYTIIQPRVSTSLPSANATPFSRLFTDAVGIDPYTKAVSDVYQDLFGEGSYLGKGIYDVRAFNRVLADRFPDGLLLSHDLIEGAHVRVALASDIELLDEFPPDYASYTARQHRWLRGDWQIADWVLPWAPRRGGGRVRNPISIFNRWKVFDNLRRSLVPASSIGLLIASWLVSPQMAWVASAGVAALFLFHSTAQTLTWFTVRRGMRSFDLAALGHSLLRGLAEMALLPHQAVVAMDAVLRVWYRRLISHRGLLEWTTAQATTWSAPERAIGFVALIILVSAFSFLAGAWVWLSAPGSLLQAAAWLALWMVSPALAMSLVLRPRRRRPREVLPRSDQVFLRRVARRTWRFFAAFVNQDTAWLPPDNFQVSHTNEVARRTSPTNIGLWLLGALAAGDLGYLSDDRVIALLGHTFETLHKLERHEGHLLNWYALPSLTPLEPRYVSSVDSGNLIASLWCLRHGLEELLQRPILDGRVAEGLRDAISLLEEEATGRGLAGVNAGLLRGLSREARPLDLLHSVRRLAAEVEPLASMPAEDAPQTGARTTDLEGQIADWVLAANRYLTWLEMLAEKGAGELAPLGGRAASAVQRALLKAPSLVELAGGRVECIPLLEAIRANADPLAQSLFPWINRVLEAFSKSKWLAGEMLATARGLIDDCAAQADRMDMGVLYDPQRRLFAIGYNVSAGRPDGAFYDLLASEARLGSYVAIADGRVPVEHWFALGRPYDAIGRRRVLLSWSGTMFEYLMPLLLQHTYDHSLLEHAVRAAVTTQVEYGRRRRVPWGISESAFADLDASKTYQYKAFGVPELGLKRGLEEEVVVAPYATLLALPVAPQAAVQNLRRLAAFGLLSEYGFYDAMDFRRGQREAEGSGVRVRAYMAHHQGMSLIALANFLLDEPFRRRFHADARVRAVAPLLQERIPTRAPLHYVTTREQMPSAGAVGDAAPSVSKFDTPHTPTPKTQLLSNGRYSLMVTNSGGGYSRWGAYEISRWRADLTRDAWGNFCYIRDVESGRLWSNAYHPVGGKVEGYAAHFALDRAVFRRVDGGILTETEVVVSPEDDVEIRRITLVNRTVRSRRLELTSYIELSMSPHGADLLHPAFNKIFIQTEALEDERVLLARRRSRRDDEPSVFVAHRLTSSAPDEGPLQFETDRRRFIGRGRSLQNPMGVEGLPGNTSGFVLDPALSIRRAVTVPPGGRVQISLVLGAAETRGKALASMEKYREPHAIDRAMDFAWASSQLELRLLRIHPDEARRFQKLASHLLYPSPQLRPAGDRIGENRKGQSGLWPYGISGDLPIVLVRISEEREIQFARQMLQAHAYWRTHGLAADLVILNEESEGYEQPLRERLEGLIRGTALYAGEGLQSGVFLLRAAHVPEEDRVLLMAVARVVLAAGRGALAQQLGAPVEAPESPVPLPRRREPREPSAHLPFMELPYFNSLGGFTPDGREYAIYLGPQTNTPAPWVNVISNPDFGTLVSETGAGFTWCGNSQRNRLTDWSNDPVVDPAGEAIYLRDEDTGAFWTTTPAPIREENAYRARHGAGYSVVEHNSHAIEQELTVFVPMDEDGGRPVKLQRLRLRNDSARRRKLSLTYYVEWTLGENRESGQMHVATHWDEECGAIVARNRYHPDYGDRVAFAAIGPPAQSYTGDRTSFLGRNRALASPAAMERPALSGRTGAGLDPCAGLRATVDLEPGETRVFICVLGQAATIEEARRLVAAYREERATEAALAATKAWWDGLLGAIEVHTPELSVDFLLNRWLLYQDLSCRLWGRTGLYQSSGAFGFRDQLQDVLALLYSRPVLAREHILLAASRQFLEGDVQHWWHPPSGAGIRSRISDDMLWLPYVVARYVRVTGDVDILHEPVPFLTAPLLEEDQADQYLRPQVAPERASLYGHCQRAVERGLTSGPHGLPLIGTGDWNDGMDQVGPAGKGESVWLAWFLARVLDDMADLADLMADGQARDSYRRRREHLVEAAERFAWDGKWYLRATFDDGTPIGSSASQEARIDSLPQSWAWLGRAADPARARIALESAWEALVHREEGLVLLLTPPFDQTKPSPGYIRGYPPGVRENGGQYTHASLWLAIAFARVGDGERAAEILRLLNPIERARDVEAVWRYSVEPYVAAADVYRLAERMGQGGWSWYTGSAAWMYRAWIEEVMGLRVRGDTLRIQPTIPGWWDGFRLNYRHGEAIYEVRVENPDGVQHDVAWVELDGRRLPDGLIPLERGLVKHRVLVRMGKPDR